MSILKKGMKNDISNWYLANRDGNKNIQMHKNENINKLEWAELNQAETVRLQVYAKLHFQV